MITVWPGRVLRSGEISVTATDTYSALSAADALDFARIAVREHVSALLSGEPGCGKTHIAIQAHTANRLPLQQVVLVVCGKLMSELDRLPPDVSVTEISTLARSAIRTSLYGMTLVFENADQLDLASQARLLNWLDETESMQAGRVGPRLLTTARKDLAEMVESGKFLRRLYHRLNTIEIPIAPLRVRTNEVVPIACHFAADYAYTHIRSIPSLSQSLCAWLVEQLWPGNVRQLRETMFQLMARTPESAQTVVVGARSNGRTAPRILPIGRRTRLIRKSSPVAVRS